MNYRILGTFVLLFFMVGAAFGQVIPNQADISAELDRRGITQQQVEAKLREKGIDLNTLDPTEPADLQMADKAIREAMNELEAEKGAKNSTKSNSNSVIIDTPREIENDNQTIISDEERGKVIEENQGDIQEAVEDGATVEEAIAEEIAEELEEKLPPAKTWGQQVFRDKKISVYQQSRDTKPPLSYVLGPGDRVAVSIWGYSQENVVFEINEDGYIKPEAMPRIHLKGISLGKAKKLLESRFSQYYRFRSEEFEVTLNFARTITVNIVGEVFNYGSFTLPARNTAFNALAASGGPTDVGSVRNIQLIRAQQKPVEIDIYRFLLNPSTEDNLFLQENDYIYVPAVNKLITIKGEIRRPFVYELKEGEGLKELANFAGGLKVNSYTDVVEITRSTGGQQKLINVNFTDILNGSRKDINLENGDIVTIKSLNKPIENAISIAGPVTIGGNFELEDSMRISDLLFKSGIEKRARLDIALLERYNIDGTTELNQVNLDSILNFPGSASDFFLKNQDKITLYEKSQLIDLKGATIQISGAVRAPRTFPYDFNNNITVSEIVTLSGGLRQDAIDTAYIHRTDPVFPSQKEFIQINVQNAIDNPNSTDNVTFQPNDRLVIYSEAGRYSSYEVSISGAVRSGGTYAYEPNLKLTDLVYFSNGLERTAADNGYLERVNSDIPGFKEYIRFNVEDALSDPNSDANLQIQPQDRIVIFSKKNYVDQFSVSIGGEVRKGGKFVLGNNLQLYDVLTMAGGLTLSASQFAYIETIDPANPDNKTYQSVDIVEVANNPGSEQNLFLSPNDRIIIYPKGRYTDNFNLDVKGEVREPGTFQAGAGLTIKDALMRAGGLTFKASRFRVELYRLKLDVQEGSSTIMIPLELDENFAVVGQPNNFTLLPFDQLIVRKIPDFDLIENIEINGEVAYPGSYPLIAKNERILDVIQRAGGVTSQSFPAGSRMVRSTKEENGIVVMKLDKVLKGRNGKKRSRYNILVKPGDKITVPRKQDLVTIALANTNYAEYIVSTTINSDKINVAYAPNKRAKYYIKDYVGGKSKKGRMGKVAVVYPNGRVKKTVNLGIVRFYPKVQKGSVIKIGAKPEKKEKRQTVAQEEKEKINWGEVVRDTFAVVTSAFTLILLVQQINK